MNGERISNNEELARYVVHRNWVRVDNTIRQNAFIPSVDLQLSVTRHLNLNEEDIWNFGKVAIASSGRSLYGRADVEVDDVRRQHLDVYPYPVLDNPNHAHIVNWPDSKHEKKMKAVEIAACASFVDCPEGMRF